MINKKTTSNTGQFVSYILITSQLFCSVFVPVVNASTQMNEADSEFKYNALLTEVASSLASQGGSEDIRGAINHTAIEQINNAAENYIRSKSTDWLSQFGTASIDLNLDDAMKLKSGELDLLVPFFSQQNERQASTWFVQPGFVFNETDQFNGRRFVHLGVGYREKSEGSFLGFNLFYDYDLDQFHHRGSLGVEYARQFFKINSNYYFPLSGWQESASRFDSIGEGVLLEERAAQGIDINFSGYLEQLPWLSLDITYQKFFGEHVEVSNGTKPMENPFISSASFNLQPISLVSFNVGYEYEHGSELEYKMGMKLNYKLGIPFEKQVRFSKTGNMKNLDLQLLDLVTRDHNIRLEYRKATDTAAIAFKVTANMIEENKEIDLVSLLSITGDKSQIKSIAFEGTAKEHIKRGTVFSAPFINAGINTYTLIATFTLQNGTQKTAPSSANLTVTENKVIEFQIQPKDVKISSVLDENNVTGVVGDINSSDGGVHVNAIIRNRFGRPVAGKTVTYMTQMPNALFNQIDVTSDVNGQVSSRLYSTKIGVVPFSITVDNFVYNGNASFDARNTNPSKTLSKISPSNVTIEADGRSQSLITLVLKDENGNALSNKEVIFKAHRNNVDVSDDPKITLTKALETSGGIYTTTLKGISAEAIDVVATVTGSTEFTLKTTVNLNSDSLQPSAATSVFVKPADLVADGQSTSELKLTLTDKNNNPLPGRHVAFTAFDNNGQPMTTGILITQAMDEGGLGIYKATISGTVVGKMTIKANVDGASAFNKSVQINLTLPVAAAPNIAQSTLYATKPELEANGDDSAQIYVKLKDANGNVLKGKNITFDLSLNGTPITNITAAGFKMAPVKDMGEGLYISSISGRSAGLLSITASVEGDTEFKKSTDITFKTFATLPSAKTSKISITNPSIPADNTTVTTITVELNDKHNNPLSEREVIFTAYEDYFPISTGIVLSEVQEHPHKKGTYTAQIRGSIVRYVTIKAEVIGVNAFHKSVGLVFSSTTPTP